jgi:hypothetical protein
MSRHKRVVHEAASIPAPRTEPAPMLLDGRDRRAAYYGPDDYEAQGYQQPQQAYYAPPQQSHDLMTYLAAIYQNTEFIADRVEPSLVGQWASVVFAAIIGMGVVVIMMTPAVAALAHPLIVVICAAFAFFTIREIRKHK